MTARTIRPTEARRSWRLWLGATLAAAAAATTVDAVLLQARRSYFTGGFLAADYLRTALETAAFLASSLVSDVTVLGVAVAAFLWGASKIGFSGRLTAAAAAATALGGVVIADFVAYQLVTYLGDAFDFVLMFDLVGRKPSEILAVAGGHLARLWWLVALVAVAAVAGFIVVRRRRNAGLARPLATSLKGSHAVVLAIALVIAGAVTTTVARSSSDVLDNGLRRKPTAQLLGAVVGPATDFDRDGFGILGRPPDPDLFDARVSPYTLEVPGNGIDEDGVGGDLPAGLPSYSETSWRGRTWRSKQDVILIVLESFRADAVGASVGGRPVTPVLDRLASSGISVQRAYSHNGYTIQSRHHILSGSLADLDAGSTMVDDFKANGYQTAYFSAQDESFGGPDRAAGFSQAEVAYDARNDRDRRYSTFSTAGSLAVPHDVLNERIGQFLDTRPRDRPLFLYVNFHDTHFPYHHRGIEPLVSDVVVRAGDLSPARVDAVREMYLNTASNVDRAIGVLLTRVRAALGREPGVIVLADHGESLFEEGFLGHGYALNEAQTRVPLIVSNLPAVVREPFGQADLRGILHAALDAPAAERPTLVSDPSRRVFQYLGAIERPPEVAFVTIAGRTTYDLRSHQAQSSGGPWIRDRDLDAPTRLQVIDLVQFWERVLLAKNAINGSSD